MALALLVVSIIMFLFGLVAAHDSDEVLGLVSLEYICLGLAFFAAAHIPFERWIPGTRA